MSFQDSGTNDCAAKSVAEGAQRAIFCLQELPALGEWMRYLQELTGRRYGYEAHRTTSVAVVWDLDAVGEGIRIHHHHEQA